MNTRGAIEAMTGIIVFMVILWVISALILADTPSALPAFNTTISLIPPTAQCSAGWIGIDGFFGCMLIWATFLIANIINIALFLFSLAATMFVIVFEICLFLWIWTGTLAFAYPFNYIFGIPLTMLGGFTLINVLNWILSPIKGWL